MTFAQLEADVFRRLRESTTSPVMWSSADVQQSLNEGLHEMADATEFYEKFQTVELLLDRPYYDMRRLMRSDFLVAGPAFNRTTNRWLLPCDYPDLERGDLRWEERIAEPERMIVRGIWWVGYWPVKGVASGEIKQYYKALPPLMSEDSDEPPFHFSLHRGLVHYACWDLFAQDGEVDLAWAEWKEYLTYEARLNSFMDNRGTTPNHRGMRPGDYGS